jgi:hypothetical protein
MMNPELDDSSEQWKRVGEVLSGYFAAIEPARHLTDRPS